MKLHSEFKNQEYAKDSLKQRICDTTGERRDTEFTGRSFGFRQYHPGSKKQEFHLAFI